MKMTTDIPRSITTPDKVETRIGTLKFFDGFPDKATVEKVYDNLDFQRGVQAYLAALPAVSIEGFRKGFTTFGSINQTVLISEQLLDAKSLFLTANTTTVYSMLYLDTKDGPLVLEIPPDVLGPIDDAWFRWVTDVGITGPESTIPSRRQPNEGIAGQCGWFSGCLFWTEGSGGQGKQLGPDHPRQGLEHHPASLRSA